MSKNITIILSTHNEELSIEYTISELIKHIKDVEIVVVDDNSPDGTVSIIKKLKNKYNWMQYQIRPKKRGLNTAYKAIYNFAYKHKYKYLITLDADLSHNTNDIKRFIPLLDKYDFVIHPISNGA